MSDLIDKEKFIYTLIFSEKTKSIFVKDLRSVIEVANEMPSAEPERKKGEWIYDTERVAGDGWTYRQYHCSECGFQELGGLQNFCPNCGADMRGE